MRSQDDHKCTVKLRRNTLMYNKSDIEFLKKLKK